jgi:hypothetical protein
MRTKDKQGRDYAKLSELRAGDMVQVDGDFTCLEPWTKHEVKASDDGLYIECGDGQHELAGQADDGEHCVGVYRAS